MAQRLLATMVTTTTHGTWLPGDLRGFVEDGVILPPDPTRLRRSKRLLRREPVMLSATEQSVVADAIIRATGEFSYRLLALSVESWHLHVLVDHGFDPVETMVGRLKTRARQAVNRGRIWTEKYDKRFCYSVDTVRARTAYINRHRGARDLSNAASCPPPAEPGANGWGCVSA